MSSGRRILFIVEVTMSRISSNLTVFRFMVAMRAAMLPKIKALNNAPEITTTVANMVYRSFLGAKSLPTIVKMA